ncbi:sensor domain-containing diguanylate cyclase [Vibrio sp. SCSIO 43137]|uniref:sensor domain-containing diguanylate cyclase n=1 Tax=Vibrio sp. SCSIO 43137 TaxID=3021011 RepID=UPI0023080A3E|nr:sensor domain-containing diguanylate cyclase [Vibrio sp. SCSIO 43137]WCE30457.1 sensor domain-containing diguanylate cyclase [Vibrio sp. SCSIO 43137]
MPTFNIDSTYGVIVLKGLEPVYVDDNYAKLFGYNSATDLMLNIDSILDLIAPQYHQSAKDNFYLLTNGIQPPRGRTYKNIDRNGLPFTVFAIDHLIEWEGEPAIQVTVLDLSIVEKAHEQLEENNRKYESLFTTSGQGIAIYRNFKPVMVNQSWVDLMHAPSIDYVLNNVNMMDFIHENEHEDMQKLYVDIIKGNVLKASRVVKNICFDGKERYFNVYYNRIDWDSKAAIQAVREDITKRVQLEKELRRTSITDSLTNVFNRHKLDKVLVDERNRFNRYAHDFSVILIDLDHFKYINDTWGHLAGDHTLITVAKALQKMVREVDVVGRWGGEEFLIICPNTDSPGAGYLAEKFRAIIENLDVSESYSLTASIGVATSQVGETNNQLLKRADTALYAAKNKGRNCVVID